MLTAQDTRIPTLGPCRIDSPIHPRLSPSEADPTYVEDDARVLYDDRLNRLLAGGTPLADLPAFEVAGPRGRIYFDPSKTRCGVVTCGGVCPGLNDVVRGLVMASHYRYGVRQIHGFRYGYEGFIPRFGHEVLDLTPQVVEDIHKDGGTILGTSRGEQDTGQIVDCLERMSISILYVIGGDGTLRAAQAIADEIDKRNLRVAVVGIPKTIDNDLMYIDRSFGFETAFSAAVQSIYAAHREATAALNGIGLVKLMGRHSGFIACHAALATNDVNFVLIPEVPLRLEGERGLLGTLKKRLERRHHAVIVAAEGAGQDYVASKDKATDASGNVRLGDIGLYLKDRINEYFKQEKMEANLKYIDPSYIVRAVPATPQDSLLCWQLAQNAVHAAMAGKTRVVIGLWHGCLVHVPMALTTSGRKRVNTDGALWLSVLEATGQPRQFE